MAEESDLERSYPATPRRLEQAREQGQVARSRELTAAVVGLVAALSIWGFGPLFVRQCTALLQSALQFGRAAAFEEDRMAAGLADQSVAMLVSLAPFLAVIAAGMVFGPLAAFRLELLGQGALPRFRSLHPIKGFKNLFSLRGFAELVKSLLKSGLIAAAGALAIIQAWGHLHGLAAQGVVAGVSETGAIVVSAVFLLVGALVVIAVIDVPYQLWNYYRGLRMTREELRQELKEQEGDPHLKARIRSLQREAARKRMMAAVPNASVIVTNPTHYAVALEYSESMRAPRVVAKGTELVAQKIKEIGAAHGVPTLEAPPLARALHRHTDLGDEIPPALYTVVAQVLAYVYQVQRWKTTGGAQPQPPQELAVPPELDPAANGMHRAAGEGSAA